MKNKVTILLGAGFAKYLKGLGTSDINHLYANYSGWRVGDETLYVYINKLLEKDYYDFNFETFLAVIENIFAFRLSQFRDGKTSTSWKDISSVLFDMKPALVQCDCFKNQETTFEVFRSYINLLNDSVGLYDDTSKCKDEIKLFKKYIAYLAGKYRKIKIYSTNYDWIVPKALGLHGSSVGVDEDMPQKAFTYDLREFRMTKLTYFPLHGCSYIYKEAFDRVHLSSTIQSMPFFAQSNHGGNPNKETLFTPIISGYSKLEHINGKPFNFGLQCFANDCYDSNLFIAMGYSFSDPHLNSTIDTFCRCNMESVTLNDIPKFPPTLGLKVHTNTCGIEDYLMKEIIQYKDVGRKRQG